MKNEETYYINRISYMLGKMDKKIIFFMYCLIMQYFLDSR